MIAIRNKLHPGLIFLTAWLFCLISPGVLRFASGWGEKAHMMITIEACRRLPRPLASVFWVNRDFLAYHALDPDRRADAEKQLPPEQATEGYKHFIDADLYGDFPFFEMPRSYERALRLYGPGQVRMRGTLPWTILEYGAKLSELMKRGEWDGALLTAAELSHYLADAHVPLHYTYNYDGQFSGSVGIHKRFEVDMVERLPLERRIGSQRQKAQYIQDVEGFVFELIPSTYIWIDNVLEADRRATLESDAFDDQYYRIMQASLRELVERLLSLAATDVASVWYTAWMKAGTPSPPRQLRLPKPEAPARAQRAGG